MGLFSWWRERHRAIFHFHDGRRARRADPLHVWALIQTDPSLEMPRHAKELDSKIDRVAALASLVVASAVRRAFKIDEFEDGGLTNAECIELFIRYDQWMLVQKKNTSPSPTSPPPMDSSRRLSPSITT